jgi:hypothetical protein
VGRTDFAIRSKGHWLIEGAWTYRMPARVSRKLHDRNEKLSPAIRDRRGFSAAAGVSGTEGSNPASSTGESGTNRPRRPGPGEILTRLRRGQIQ